MKTSLLVRRPRHPQEKMTKTINPESPTTEDENQRLLTLELMLNIQRKRRSRHLMYYSELITTIIVIFMVLVMGNELYSSKHFLIHGVGANEILSPYTNSKIFIHNRTSSISSSSKIPHKGAAVAPLPIVKDNKHKSKPKTPLIKNRGKTVKTKNNNKLSETGEMPLSETNAKPNHPVITTFNANNHHNYFATAINFLMTGLSSSSTTTVKPKLRKQQLQTNVSEPLPKPLPQKSGRIGPSAIHPLAVLETEIKNSSSSFDIERNPEGRSNLEYEPLYEASYDHNGYNETRSSNGIKSPKNLHANFFDKFEDHYDDPIAEESKAPEAFADFTGGGTGPVASIVKPPSKYTRPSWKKPQSRPESDYALSGSSREIDSVPSGGSLSYDTTGLASEGTSSFDQTADDSAGYNAHKNVNYWPQNLNSYYGDQFTSQYNNNLYGRRPNPDSPSHFNKPKFVIDHRPHQGQHHQRPQNQNHQFKKHKSPPPPSEITVNDINQPSESVKKVSMVERVSVFYSEYKLFTWAVVSIVAALAAIGVLLALYLNNPPTEVVTAKRELMKSLNEDPMILKFLDNLMQIHGGSVHSTSKLKTRSKSNSNPSSKT